jgi:RNA-directed DNA polymerase
MYHDKFDYADFLSCRVTDNCELSRYRDRDLLKPNKKLKAYLKFLNLFLFELLPVNTNVVFSYRKGVGSYDAIAPHSCNKYFFQTDIKSFFSSIDRDLVLFTIESGKNSSSISDIEQHFDRILELTCIDNQLPTGFSTSPVITNSVLKIFDDVLAERCSKQRLTLTRYSDDIIISASSNDTIYNAGHLVKEVLADTFGDKLRLNQDKSRYFKTGGRIKILGMLILPNGQITVEPNIRKEIEVLLHFYRTDREKFLDKVNGDLEAGKERISGYLNYVNTVNQQYLDKLRHKYGAATVDMFLHRAFN